MSKTSAAVTGSGSTRCSVEPASSGVAAGVVIASTTKSTGTTLKGAAERPNCGIGSCRHRARDHPQHVVGAVELLRLARARVADHDRRAVDRGGHAVHRLAHPQLGLELGRLVVVLEPLPERELVLVDRALAVAGHVGGAHVVQALEPLAVLAELEHVAGAVHVHALRDLERHREVVDGGQVVGPRSARRRGGRRSRRRAPAGARRCRPSSTSMRSPLGARLARRRPPCAARRAPPRARRANRRAGPPRGARR